MNKILHTFEKKNTCSNCKNIFEWNENSEWFGAIENIKTQKQNIAYKVCSKICKIEIIKNLKRLTHEY